MFSPSLDVASRISDWANFFFIGSLVVGVVSTVLISRMANVKEDHWNELRRTSDEKIAEANARQKEAELKLELLRKVVGPRSFDFEILKKELEGKPRAPVAIWYLPDSSDGFWLATRLVAALSDRGWRVDRPLPIPEVTAQDVEAVMPGVPQVLPVLLANPRAMNAGGQPSGVTVVGDYPPNTNMDMGANTPFTALFNALAKSMDFGVAGSNNSQFLPVSRGTLRIVIAAKTDPMFADKQPAATGDNPK
jgi:hypothetical protein